MGAVNSRPLERVRKPLEISSEPEPNKREVRILTAEEMDLSFAKIFESSSHRLGSLSDTQSEHVYAGMTQIIQDVSDAVIQISNPPASTQASRQTLGDSSDERVSCSSSSLLKQSKSKTK